MKINFGKFKKRNILVGNNNKMKPTQSITKDVIFNLLKINNDTKVLDLFAGTGLLGFESAYLCAGKVIWIDNNNESIKTIKKNILDLKLSEDNFKAFKSDFRMGFKKLPFKPDIIFIDPPFTVEKYYEETLQYIHDKNLLSKYGVLVLDYYIIHTINCTWSHDLIVCVAYEINTARCKRSGLIHDPQT